MQALSNVEILERALAKARASNPDWKPLLLDRPEDLIRMGHENMVLFNRGFAQAFWGEASHPVVRTGSGGAWDHLPPGVMHRQIESMISRGVDPDAACRYARAMMFGGATTAEALAIIRDCDCAHLGTAIELWHLDEIPTDRWFRDAWRRSHNGGPILIDLKRARPIQWKKARDAVECENRRRQTDYEAFGSSLIEVDWLAFRERLRSARDEIDLRAVWPAVLGPAKAV